MVFSILYVVFSNVYVVLSIVHVVFSMFYVVVSIVYVVFSISYIVFLILSPSGYTCDVKDGRCNKGEASIPFYKKIVAKKVTENIACPGGGSECPTGTTCCQLADGEYGCCPVIKIL